MGGLRPTRGHNRCNEAQDRDAGGGNSDIHGKARECARDASMLGQIEGTIRRMRPVNDPAGDPARTLRQAFGDSLYSAAEQVAQSGNVLEIRVLQAGNVVTGIVGGDVADAQHGAKFRVYIRNLTAKMEGECSCGERGVCVHVAAVSIVAARTLNADAANEQRRPDSRRARGADTGVARRGAAGAGSKLQGAPAQQLCYLLEKVCADGASRFGDTGAFSEAGTFGEIRLSIWVAQRAAGVGSIQADSACAFAPRLPRGVPSAEAGPEYPRYVDDQDREILKALAPNSESPWVLRGETGAGLLLRIAATGRAFWRSLQQQPLRSGQPRAVAFVWRTLPGGEQVLSWEDAQSLDVIVNVEPIVYIDSASND